MTIRIGAIQAAGRIVSYEESVGKALERVRVHLDDLAGLGEKAALEGCAIAAFPEDCLGTLEWEAGHWEAAADLDPGRKRRG